MSHERQSDFAAALAAAGASLPEGIRAWNGPRPQRRFEVYRNNVASGLTAALASQFPATERIVGEHFFRAMALEFIRLQPPRSPLLLGYGHAMPDFVAGFEPAAPLAYLPDVMRIEAARSRAYHAEDAAPLDPAQLAAVPGDHLPSLRLIPHPSLAIVRSPHPAVTIWSMNAADDEVVPIDDWRGEDALVVRPAMLVEVHRLPPGGAVLLSALAAGAMLGEAVEAALADHPEFDLTANLTGMLQAGAFTAVSSSIGATS